MDDQRRILREAVEAQRGVIGSLLLDGRCAGVVMSMLRPDDFTDGTCRTAFTAIRKRFLEGKPIDTITILAEDVSRDVDFVQWERDLMEQTPTAANVESYAEDVRARAALFRLWDCGRRLEQAADLDEARGIVSQASGLTVTAGRDPTVTALELARDFVSRMLDPRKPEYLPWGIPTVDRETFVELGDMCVLGGYASAGKTLLSLIMALAQAKKYKVGYYSLETQPQKSADRLFSHLCQLSLRKIKDHDRLDDGDKRNIADQADLFVKNTPLDFIPASGWTVEDIAFHALSKGYQIIYVDYLQLIAGTRKNESEYERVSAVSQGLKAFGQTHRVTVVALSQLARKEKTKSGDPIPPDMSSYRSSGQIEQDADVAFLLWPSDPNDNNSPRNLKIAKNKEGRRKTIWLSFCGDTQTMAEMETPPDMSVASQMSSKGRAVKKANRANAMAGHAEFYEVSGRKTENPFAY